MIKGVTIVIVLLSNLFFSGLSAQSKIEIFADTEGNDTLQQLVGTFTTQLKKSTPAIFVVRPVSQYSGKGIYLNITTKNDQPVKPPAKLLQSGVEAFSGEANGSTVQIIGNSNMAIGHGIFTYLDLIGYRFYFANQDWHIVPNKPNLFPKWSIVSRPSFDHRRIWYGYGTGSKIADDDYNFWFLANRQGGSVNAYFSHAYEEIISRNREVFLQHPEWFYPQPPRGTISQNDPKFDMTREDLIQFLVQDFEKRIQASMKNKTNDYKMLSLGPSDGLGTCNTPACQKLGTMTDRVYYLVNRVAKALQKKYPATYVGCIAYGEYSAPPTKNVEPNVFVGITTAFNSSTYSVEQLVDEWRKKGAFIGIYDYFSWYAWDFDVPGQSIASRTEEIAKTLRKYYNKGVRVYEAESSIGWISKGLGYYIASKLMWDIKANDTALKNEFFELCFGKAASTMRRLWDGMESYNFSMIRETDLAKWIDYVLAAEKIETSTAVQKRFFQVKSYLHNLYLYHRYQEKKSESSLLALLNYGYRKLDDGSVAGYPAFFELGNRSGIKDMGFVENAKWKYNSSPVTMNEMNSLIAEDRRNLKVLNAVKDQPVAKKFTTIPDVKKFVSLYSDSATADNAFWFTNEYLIEIKKKSADNYIDFAGDFIGDTTNKRSTKISVYPYSENGDITGKTPLYFYEYNKIKVKDKLSLANLAPGYYTVIVEDPGKVFRIGFSKPVNFSLVMRPQRTLTTPACIYSFLYVPDGVKYFNAIKTGELELITPTGRKIVCEKNKQEDVQIAVQKGESGLWRIKLATAKLYVEGIPPLMGTSPAQMLIPLGN